MATCRACSSSNLAGLLVSERRVATLGIIDVFDEAWQRGSDVIESLVLHQVDFLNLERLHEALGLGVVVWVAASTHRTVEAVLGELGAVMFFERENTGLSLVVASGRDSDAAIIFMDDLRSRREPRPTNK
jgi:hypothetical protein